MRFSASILLLSASLCAAAAAQQAPGDRVYLEGRAVDAVLLPDGSVAYVLELPPEATRRGAVGPRILVAHPALGPVTRTVDPVTGKGVAIGTDPDGTYHGFAWFMENVPDVIEGAEAETWIPLFETRPPEPGEPSAGRATPAQDLQAAAVLKWWAAWEEWLETLNAENLVPHSGIVTQCRETDAATVVTLKGDGTFQFLYRDRDRVTYEGLQATSPCDVVGQRVIAWTLPCGDDGPCIRKIEGVDAPTGPPREARIEAAADALTPHAGLIDACRPRGASTVVTVKGNGTSQFLYRSADRVVYEGLLAGSPCDLIGRRVVVWTAACDDDGPCIRRIAVATSE